MTGKSLLHLQMYLILIATSSICLILKKDLKGQKESPSSHKSPHGLDTMILIGPFQPEIFYDCMLHVFDLKDKHVKFWWSLRFQISCKHPHSIKTNHFRPVKLSFCTAAIDCCVNSSLQLPEKKTPSLSARAERHHYRCLAFTKLFSHFNDLEHEVQH